jgi:dihydroorotase
MLTRREFSKTLLTVGTAAFVSRPSWANRLPLENNPGSEPMYDLIIKGGTVIDPSQKLHGVMDVAIKGGKIAEVSADIPEARALVNFNRHRQIVDAKGHIVTPGFVDLHVHCYDGIGIGINADHYCLGRGVTTAVDAGSTGPLMIRRFVQDIVNTSKMRVYAWVHIGLMGAAIDPKHRYQGLDWVNPQMTAEAAEANRPASIGVKVHLQKELTDHPDLELEYLNRALSAAELAHMPLMGHIWNTYNELPTIMNKLRKGDVYTHCFNEFPHNILDANGKIHPEVREARQRGVIFDVGEGPGHLSLEVVEKCLQQDFLPDTLGTDLANPFGVATDDRDDLPTLASRFLAMGMSLDQVVERATINPARVCNWGIPLGTLKPGSPADVSIFELRDGKFNFKDTSVPNGRTVVGQKMLVNKSVVCRGELYSNIAG